METWKQERGDGGWVEAGASPCGDVEAGERRQRVGRGGCVSLWRRGPCVLSALPSQQPLGVTFPDTFRYHQGTILFIV